MANVYSGIGREWSTEEMANIYCFLFASVLATCIIINNGAAIEEETEAIRNKSLLTASLSSLFPSSTCKPFSGLKRNSSLEVIQRHGPCFEQKHGEAEPKSPTHIIDMLSDDQARVNSIHSKLSKRFSHENMKHQPDSANISVRSGLPINTGGFIVTVGLGSPKTDLSLILDTGSDITWTQCEPCIVTCYSQQEPIFDPSKSTTYSHINCSSSMCTQIFSTGKYQECANSTETCIYKSEYADASFSVGFLSKESLTIGSGDTFDNFLFGCGQNNGGNTLGNVAGILGLNRDPISFVQQTANTYNKVVSYCLPSTTSSVGHLTFGSDRVPNNVQFTPISTLIDYPTSYGISITGITVGGTEISSVSSTLSSTKAIIDSGTTVTRLPPSVYAAMRSEFRLKMAMYPRASELVILDTCYDFSGYDTVEIPKISLVFGGGVKQDLGLSGIFYVASMEQVCLAFAPNEREEDILIMGNIQQKTIEVVYDLNAERLGFGPPGSCD